MRALSINKLEKPLTPPPSDRPLSESHLPSVVTLHVPRVSKVFLDHGLSPPDPPELCVAAVCSDSCPAPLVDTDEFEFVTVALEMRRDDEVAVLE
ncbi:MAG: hypothetical protein Q9175_001450 [Cornicularia normoerica]